MPSLSSSLLFLRGHLWLGLVAALLFGAGLGTSVVVVRRQVRWLMALPLWVVRRVMAIIGPGFPPLRVFLVIFCFNSVAIFLYMASGVLVCLPAAIAFLTGVNIGVIVLKADEVQGAAGETPPADSDEQPDVEVGPLASLCGLAVLLIELPCFWLSIGMGIRMGRRLALDFAYTLHNMGRLLAPRAAAYVSVILPALFLSAIAETVAIRGHMRAKAHAPHPDGDDEPPDEPGDRPPPPGADEQP